MFTIRPIEDSDLDVIFEFQGDPESCQMATVPSRQRGAFDDHMAKLRANPDSVVRTIDVDGIPVGYLLSWIGEKGRMIGYWIGRSYWGQGIASQGLTLFLAELKERPLIAHVASTNLGSQRILEKNGFLRVGQEVIEDSNFGRIELMTYRLS